MSFVLGGSININYNRNLNINYKSSKEREGFNVTHSLEEGNITTGCPAKLYTLLFFEVLGFQEV